MASPLALLDPRLVLRALDDLHSLAEGVTAMAGIERRVTERMDHVEALLAEALDVLKLLAGIERRAVEVLERIDRIDERAQELLVPLGRVDDLVGLAEEVREQTPAMHELLASVRALNAAAATLAAAAEPLQGATERLGRVADRLPGARRRS